MAEPDVIELKGECGVVNLRDYNLSPHDRMALWFQSPEGNRCRAESASLREGWLWLWTKGTWMCLDVTECDLSCFGDSITLLPLPEGVDVYTALGASLFATIRYYTAPLT